jgi:cell division protein FtsB
VEFSFDKQTDNNQGNAGSASSERLRKAIERNRAKQAKRGVSTASASGSRASASVPSQSWSAPGETSTAARRSTGRSTSSTRAAATASTRRSVASADNVEFTTALRKGVSKSPASVSYSKATKKPATSVTTKYKTSTRRKKAVTVKPNEYLVRGIWVFCAFLLLRLVFSNGGITDYYDKKEVLVRKEQALERLHTENKDLVAEIEKIKTNASYQKKIVRHHLGHIAKDEYLVLFSN